MKDSCDGSYCSLVVVEAVRSRGVGGQSRADFHYFGQPEWFDRCGLGAGTGAIIGSTVGHAAVGALIGDQLMGQEKKQEAQAVQSNENRREIDRLAARTNGFDTNERTIG